jgi:catechol-2,3-dioxygenase
MTDNTANARVELVALDVADIEGLTGFWTQLTGWNVARAESDWVTLRTGEGFEVALQKAPDHVPPQWPGQEHPQQFHLDLLVADPEASAQKAEKLGATRLGEGPSWITLADPAGHPFDLCRREGAGEVMGLYAATIDAPDAAALAKFYGRLLGLELAYEGPEGALLSPEGSFGVMFQQISGYNAPRWPDPRYPQQAHLDIQVDDLDAGEAHALEAGATRLEGGSDTFRVFADPAGHPFCLTS